ncbi:MAG TPA: transposase, partial [Dehalococcoidia bacterium]|nr:transposase [Dehalococcoidia bacterium]
MAYNLLACDREQGYLMPPSLKEWLAEGHLAWFIMDAVDQMDLGEFYASYRNDGWGAAAYDPEMMVAVLLYAYCRGIRSSRRIAQALEEDVGFRVVAANRQPDFRTICRFRAEHEDALERLFVEVLRMCREVGLVKLGVVALDGTKVAANASLAANRSYEAIQEEVRKILAEAKAVDAEEDALLGPDRRGDELPGGLGRRAERLKRLREARERLKQEAEAVAKVAQERLAQRQAEETATGKTKRGRKPRVVEPVPALEARANVTDPDSRVMKTRQGYVQGYNVQAVVSEDQIIVAVEVTQEAYDVHQLLPMLERTKENLE